MRSEVFETDLGDDEKRKILWDNYSRFYGAVDRPKTFKDGTARKAEEFTQR